MESFFILLGLLLLAFPIVAIVALVKSVGLGDQLRRVDARVATLERRIAAGPAPSAAGAEPPRPAPASPIAEPPVEKPAPPVAAASPIAPPQAAPATPAAPMAASAPAAPAMSFEERLGTQWAVWVGGIALALGGIFLVRYSIEQGLLGPGVRVTLGALLAIALIVAGERSRRTEKLAGIAGLSTAHIPSILTAAGTTVAFGDV